MLTSHFYAEAHADYTRQRLNELRASCRPFSVPSGAGMRSMAADWRIRLGRSLIGLGEHLSGSHEPVLPHQRPSLG